MCWPGKGAFPLEARPHLGLEPFVQHIVQNRLRMAWALRHLWAEIDEACPAVRGYSVCSRMEPLAGLLDAITMTQQA